MLDDLWDEFCEWFKRALPVIRTKDRLVSFDAFCDGWKRVILPMGGDLLRIVFEAAKTRPPLKRLERYEHENLNFSPTCVPSCKSVSATGPSIWALTKLRRYLACIR